jgi:hypothetical protein
MQVTLTSEQHRRAKEKAAASGVSLAECIRRVVAADLDERRPSGDIRAIIGIVDSGGCDVARDNETARVHRRALTRSYDGGNGQLQGRQ